MKSIFICKRCLRNFEEDEGVLLNWNLTCNDCLEELKEEDK